MIEKHVPGYGRAVWKKLRKDKLAFAGLIIILIFFFIAAFAYLISPDGTTNADLQTVEIQARQPGYKQLFLQIPIEKQSTSLLKKFISGAPSGYNYIPIKSYQLRGDSVYVNKYIDTDTGIAQVYPLYYLQNNKKQKAEVKEKKFWLGTDLFGRDILSRLLLGTRVSLAVGLIAVVISLSLGLFLGAIAGYYRGRLDKAIMWLINVTWSIPTLLLVFAITLALGKGFWQIFIAVGLTLWVSVARLVRGQVIAVKEQEYIQAAKALGLKNGRIILRHILPNIIGPILVLAAANFATAIIIEAGLSFLGLGVQPPTPSWGLMIKENYNFLITRSPFLAIIPGLFIMVLVLAFNLLGNGLRDATDVK